MRFGRSEANLRALGLAGLLLFGSTARGEASPESDVDPAVALDRSAGIDLFRFAAISGQLARMLGVKVDLVVEPARNPRLQARIDRDHLRVT